jgi:hypothetical protein
LQHSNFLKTSNSELTRVSSLKAAPSNSLFSASLTALSDSSSLSLALSLSISSALVCIIDYKMMEIAAILINQQQIEMLQCNKVKKNKLRKIMQFRQINKTKQKSAIKYEKKI